LERVRDALCLQACSDSRPKDICIVRWHIRSNCFISKFFFLSISY
jgi:hypothetical protein